MTNATLARGSSAASPLSRSHMPTDYSISLREYTRRGTPDEARIPVDFGPRQSLRGFQEGYRNIIDYIVRITYRIWEDREVDYIRDTYSDACHVYDDYGLQRGSNKIVADTRHTIGAFSDIQLIADEIVWAGDDRVGFHTSHRTIIRGVNDGDSRHGPATGKPVDVLVIANCVALRNKIFVEHVLYNNASMLRQLGFDLDAAAARLAAAPPAPWPWNGAAWNGLRAAARPARPLYVAEPVQGFDVDRFARENFEALWNRRSFDVLDVAYAPGFAFQGPTDRAGHGAAAYQAFLEEILAAFPDLELQVDEVYWMGNDADGYLTSERWSAVASHTGDGRYGPPTGRVARLWGITQHEIRDGRVHAEWMLFNELDVMMQLAP